MIVKLNWTDKDGSQLNVGQPERHEDCSWVWFRIIVCFNRSELEELSALGCIIPNNGISEDLS